MGTLTGGVRSYGGNTSDLYTTPFPHALGTRARDSAGNEYILCSVGALASVAPEMAVQINSAYTITPVTTGGHRGPIGVVADLDKAGNTSAGTSAVSSGQALWVQVYGRAFVQTGGGGLGDTSANHPTTLLVSTETAFWPPTTVISTPVGQLVFSSDTQALTTLGHFYIYGMTVATDATVSDVSAVCNVCLTHGGHRTPVWLNYPHISRRLTVPSVT